MLLAGCVEPEEATIACRRSKMDLLVAAMYEQTGRIHRWFCTERRFAGHPSSCTAASPNIEFDIAFVFPIGCIVRIFQLCITEDHSSYSSRWNLEKHVHRVDIMSWERRVGIIVHVIVLLLCGKRYIAEPSGKTDSIIRHPCISRYSCAVIKPPNPQRSCVKTR